MSHKKKIVIIILASIGVAAIVTLISRFILQDRQTKEEYTDQQGTLYLPTFTPHTKTLKINLYFAGPGFDKLQTEEREIYQSPDISDLAKQAIIELIKGPQTGLIQTIPEGTILQEVFIDRFHNITIDFSQELSSNHPGGTWAGIMTIGSIVYTLINNFTGIQKVYILIAGEEIPTLTGHLNLKQSYTINTLRNFDLIEQESEEAEELEDEEI